MLWDELFHKVDIPAYLSMHGRAGDISGKVYDADG